MKATAIELSPAAQSEPCAPSSPRVLTPLESELLEALRIAASNLGKVAQFIGRVGYENAAGQMQCAAQDAWEVVAKAEGRS